MKVMDNNLISLLMREKQYLHLVTTYNITLFHMYKGRFYQRQKIINNITTDLHLQSIAFNSKFSASWLLNKG